MIPVIGFAAYSGTGKTTVMEKVIAELTARGLRVGTVKHDGHGFEIDRPGRDSFRHAQAGARTVVITSPGRTAVLEQRGDTLTGCLERIRDADVIREKLKIPANEEIMSVIAVGRRDGDPKAPSRKPLDEVAWFY